MPSYFHIISNFYIFFWNPRRHVMPQCSITLLCPAPSSFKSFLSSQTVIELCYLLPKTNIGTLVVSIVAIVGLILAKELNTYLSKKLPVPLPIELVAVSTKEHLQHRKDCWNSAIYLLLSALQIVLATVISWQVDLQERYGVDVVGKIPSGWEKISTYIYIYIHTKVKFVMVLDLCSVPLRQPQAARFAGRVFVRPGDWGRLRPVCGWLWHRHFSGANICPKIWLQGGQQPGSEETGGCKSDLFSFFFYFRVYK